MMPVLPPEEATPSRMPLHPWKVLSALLVIYASVVLRMEEHVVVDVVAILAVEVGNHIKILNKLKFLRLISISRV
jgi:hypothetical protein